MNSNSRRLFVVIILVCVFFFSFLKSLFLDLGVSLILKTHVYPGELERTLLRNWSCMQQLESRGAVSFRCLLAQLSLGEEPLGVSLLKGNSREQKRLSKEGFPLNPKRSPNCAHWRSHCQLASQSEGRHSSPMVPCHLLLHCPAVWPWANYVTFSYSASGQLCQWPKRGTWGLHELCSTHRGSRLWGTRCKKCTLPGHKAYNPPAILQCVMVTVGCDFPLCFPSGMRWAMLCLSTKPKEGGARMTSAGGPEEKWIWAEASVNMGGWDHRTSYFRSRNQQPSQTQGHLEGWKWGWL